MSDTPIYDAFRAMTAEPRFPANITISKFNGHYQLLVDGESFPWMIAEGSVFIEGANRDEVPAVTVTLLAESVTAELSARLAYSKEQRDA